MGRAKDAMLEQQDLEATAAGLLVELGILKECENHPGTLFDGGGSVEDAYPVANAKISRDEIKLPGGASRRDFTDAIKSVYADNSGLGYCVSCDKNMQG